MTSRYEELKAQRDILRTQLQDAAKAHFTELAASVFAEHPVLESFSWTQYTPYFNDGDECVFSTHTDSPKMTFVTKLVDGPAEDHQEQDGKTFYDKRGYTGIHAVPGFPNTPQEKAGCSVVDFLAAFDDADLKDMFGDHIEVTVRRDGVDVDEYEHE